VCVIFNETCGHTEWVTTCACLPDGRVLSGGMDGKVILWNSSGPSGADLLGHTASISRVMVDSRDIGISASYDRTIRIWNLSARSHSRSLSVLQGLGGAVTSMDWYQSLLVSGTREGQIGLWDVNTGNRIRWLTPQGQGQILSLRIGSLEAGVTASDDASRIHSAVHGNYSDYNWLVCATGSDGFIRLYDLRTETSIFQRRLSEGQPGSVNDVAFSPHGYLVTALSDGVGKVLDMRSGFKTISILQGHQSPVTNLQLPIGTDAQIAVSTGSNGWLCVHDLRGLVHAEDTEGVGSVPTIQPKYAFGLTSQGGINALWSGSDRVVAAGDDGQPNVLK
jgi:WD40 repeat protein